MIQQPPPAYQQQQAGVVQQHQVVTVHPPATAVATNNNGGNWGGMKATGICQLVLGVMTIIFGIVSITIGVHISYIASPIWGGLCFYIVAGILGITSGVKRNQCAAVGYMVMSIMACLASVVVIGFSAGAIPWDLYRYSYSYYYYGYNRSAKVAMSSILIILGLIEFIVAIVGASMTCGAVCCNSPSQTVVHYQAHPQVLVPGQQQVYYTAQVPQQQFGPYVTQVPQQQFVAYNPQAPPPTAPQAQQVQLPPQGNAPGAVTAPQPQDDHLYQPLKQ